MVKYKAARPGKKPSPVRGAIPCLVMLISGMVLLFLLFYAMLRSAGS